MISIPKPKNESTAGFAYNEQPQSAPANVQLRRILVPVDFSEGTLKSIQYAAALSDRFGAAVTLLHVIQLRVSEEIRVRLLDEHEQSSMIQLRNLIKLWKSCMIWTAVVREGHPHEQIVEEARENGANLIIIPTHGHRGLLRWIRRNTVARVVRHAPCPVLVVRIHEHGFVFDSALANLGQAF